MEVFIDIDGCTFTHLYILTFLYLYVNRAGKYGRKLARGYEPSPGELGRLRHAPFQEMMTKNTSGPRALPSGKSLVEWERRLPAEDFLRVHRGAIVNLRHVDRVEPWSNYSYRVHLRGWDEPITMSRRYAVDVRDRLA